MTVTVPGGYLRVDVEGIVREVNDDVARYLELGHELVGQRLDTVLPLVSRVFFQTHVYPALARDGRVDEVYLSLRAKSGDAVHVVLNGRRMPSGDVELLFLPMRRRAFFERELVRAQQAAERSAQGEAAAYRKIDGMQLQLALAERMASIGELAAAVAHEINNPLAYVSANADLLAAEVEGGTERASVVKDLQLGLARIREIVASLKKLSRVDQAERVPVDLVGVIEDALKIGGNALRHRARVELAIEARGMLVMGDEGRLGQVVLNLLINAAQALPEARLAENVVRVELRRLPSDVAELVVADNGPGVPRDLRDRIFEPFFTTKPVGAGTGLGLSVCHGVIGSLGGSIVLESPTEGGARFVIHLPVAPSAAKPEVQAAPASASSAPADARRLHVLLVDDDEGVGRALRRVLREHEVEWVGASSTVWKRFERDGLDGYDAIVCDLMMPDMSGMELFARVTARAPHLRSRFVFLTGGAFTEEARVFLEEPGRRTITKPFKVPELRATVLDVGLHASA